MNRSIVTSYRTPFFFFFHNVFFIQNSQAYFEFVYIVDASKWVLIKYRVNIIAQSIDPVALRSPTMGWTLRYLWIFCMLKDQSSSLFSWLF